MRFLPIMAAAIVLLPAQTRAETTLDALARAMAADKVSSIRFSGTGFVYGVGQSYQAGEAWPKFNLTNYTVEADYRTASVAQDVSITQWENPPRGGARQPIEGTDRRKTWLSGATQWSMQGKTAVESTRGVSDAIHALWTTPHGVVKAAMAQNAKPETRAGITTVAFEIKGHFRAVALFGENNRLERVEARVANPVLGDMLVVTDYANYRMFGGIPFPTRIDQTTDGQPSLQLRVNRVQPNAAVEIAVPADLRRARERVTVTKAADGVYLLAGGSHNSVAIEMNDHVVLYEAPLGEGRAMAVIEAVQKAIPGKPIRYVIASHHHFDHSGGVRAAVATGATLITSNANRDYLERALNAPATVDPDRLARSGVKPKIEGFTGKHVLSDGSRTIEIHQLEGSTHANGLSIAWLPRERIMIVADAFSPRQLMKAPAKTVNPFTANLWQNVERLKLDIATILPIHGQKVGLDQLKLAAGMAHDH